ncbi:tyrosine recombinase XerC2 (plasmid) [Butyrivibrio proteoclasticus B316]|uniref:Tyrosine recombinase XerC2 n=2 Tax=Butyrivibrio proteoclasticus TaxID=43305 RepID=E0S3G4_BUTPB|nr:tyrosine recombinase XerC2 [Butyrivibrio proteoclasticus B316]
MGNFSFKDEQEAVFLEQLESQIIRLPKFVQDYIESSRDYLSVSTLLQYTYDFVDFFTFLSSRIEKYKDKPIPEYTLVDMMQLSCEDMDECMKWYKHPDKDVFRKPRTINRFLSTLSSLFTFYVKRRKLADNPVSAVRRPAVKRKEVNRLYEGEKSQFLSAVMNGTGLTKRQLPYHERQWLRDYTIARVFLFTGIRVSELVGLDISDVNLREHSLRVVRKGGNIERVYLDDETDLILREYLAEREEMELTDDETALFISRKKQRIGVRAVEKLIKKYQQAGLPSHPNGLTPHRLRATFATDLYSATGDIYRTSKAMGHKSIATTTIYAEVSDKQKKEGRNILLSSYRDTEESD